MTYFDTFIRDSVNYACPDGTVEHKYQLRKMMADVIQGEPKRPQPKKPEDRSVKTLEVSG